MLVLSFSREGEIAGRLFLPRTSVDGNVQLTLPVKAIDKTFSNELVYDAIVGDGFD